MTIQIYSDKIHAIQIGVELNVKTIADKNKELIKYNLIPVVIDKVNSHTEALISMIGETHNVLSINYANKIMRFVLVSNNFNIDTIDNLKYLVGYNRTLCLLILK